MKRVVVPPLLMAEVLVGTLLIPLTRTRVTVLLLHSLAPISILFPTSVESPGPGTVAVPGDLSILAGVRLSSLLPWDEAVQEAEVEV